MDFPAFLARIKQRHAALKARFGDEHPEVQALEDDLKEAEAAQPKPQDTAQGTQAP